MGTSIVGHWVAICGLGLLAVACGSSNNDRQASNDHPAITCKPDSTRCNGQNVELCDASGQSETVAQTCKADQFCRDDGAGAHCDKQACSPNQPICDGTVATTCMADGTGPAAGGNDCKDSGDVCMLGKCFGDVAPPTTSCTPGDFSCQSGNLYACGNDGATQTVVQFCRTGQLCDADLEQCTGPVCVANQSNCEGMIAKTCNATGSAWLPDTDDCSDGRMCVNGKCVQPNTCNPGQRSCKDGNVYQCGTDGQTLTLALTCERASKLHCATTGVYAFCTEDVCVPGQKVCDQNTSKVCNDDGSLPDDGTDCGDDAWCESGECTPRTCTENTYYCSGMDVYYCNSDQPPTLISHCPDTQGCLALPGAQDPQSGSNGALCAPLPCAAGAAVCLQNQLGTCATDGASVTQVTTDCAAGGNVCTSDGKCAASVMESLGIDESVQPAYADYFAGDVIAVTSTRKLSGLGTWLVFQTTRQLRWVLYEQTSSSFVAKIDKVVTVASSTGLVAAPDDFTYTLQAGKAYLLGVVVSGGGATLTTDTAPFPQPSFGTLLGSVDSTYMSTYSYLDSFSTEGVFQLQVTTALP